MMGGAVSVQILDELDEVRSSGRPAASSTASRHGPVG